MKRVLVGVLLLIGVLTAGLSASAAETTLFGPYASAPSQAEAEATCEASGLTGGTVVSVVTRRGEQFYVQCEGTPEGSTRR